MKTINLRTFRNIFQGAAMLSLFALFSFSGTVKAQQTAISAPHKTEAGVSGTLQGNIFPSLDPLKLKVVFVNPGKESISLLVLNEDKQIVYRKVIGMSANYNGKFDVSGLPDGNYILQVQGSSHSLSQNFQISTQVARLTQIQ